ncbi:MAG: hypothetical protein ACLUIQ_05690 [Dialister invisus]
MPSILRSIVLSTLGTIFFVLALLWAIGDERFVPGLSNPHLLTSAGVLLLTNTGLFIIFKRISEEIFLSVSPFTLHMVCRLYLGLWLHVPAGKQVSRRLLQHDFPLFSLSYLSLAWKWKLKRGAFLWSVLAGLFFFFMILVP